MSKSRHLAIEYHKMVNMLNDIIVKSGESVTSDSLNPGDIVSDGYWFYRVKDVLGSAVKLVRIKTDPFDDMGEYETTFVRGEFARYPVHIARVALWLAHKIDTIRENWCAPLSIRSYVVSEQLRNKAKEFMKKHATFSGKTIYGNSIFVRVEDRRGRIVYVTILIGDREFEYKIFKSKITEDRMAAFIAAIAQSETNLMQ